MRPSWDEYFLEVAEIVATRATCPRASVGAVLVRENRILTTGYNGAPPKIEHCTNVGCMLIDGHCARATHAEANAIVQGALHGIRLDNATAYVTHEPCLGCTKLLLSAGIIKIIHTRKYPDANAARMLTEANVPIEQREAQKSV